jgi:alpha-beta hydrolase superfamily lysophospholipase
VPTSELSYKSADGTKIVAYRWEPEGEPRAAVQLTVRTYPDARHEILNETNRDEVIAGLNGWLDRVIAGSGRCR